MIYQRQNILYLVFSIEVTFNSHNEETRSRLWIHTIHLLPEKAYRDKETLDVITLEPEAQSVLIVPTVVSPYN